MKKEGVLEPLASLMWIELTEQLLYQFTYEFFSIDRTKVAAL